MSGDYYEALRRRREAELRQVDESMAVLNEIAAHPETVRISKDVMPGPWEFVERAFPSVSGVVVRLVVYKNQNTAFCKRLGLPPEAGGLFFTKASAILICDSDFKDDVVIVHELLHYVSRLLGGAMRNQALEENFAYSNSIPYLVLHGYDDEWIAEKYMLPYYYSFAQHEWRDGNPTHKGRIPAYCLETVRTEAKKACLSMIANAKGTAAPRRKSGHVSRFEGL